MALMTDAQREGAKEAENEARTWVNPVYCYSPDAGKVESGEKEANVFYFRENTYPKLKMVAIDRRFVYTTGSIDNDDLETVTCVSDKFETKTDEYLALLEREGDTKNIKISYDYLMFLPELGEFAVFNVKSYARELNKDLTKADNSGKVFDITPNIHRPNWSKFKSKLYLYTHVVTDEVVDPTGNEDYQSELHRFLSLADAE